MILRTIVGPHDRYVCSRVFPQLLDPKALLSRINRNGDGNVASLLRANAVRCSEKELWAPKTKTGTQKGTEPNAV
jgi:hypothetical protein